MRLLVGVDGRDGGRDALELARLLAAQAGGSVEAVTVLYGGPLPMEYARLEGEEAAEADSILADARERLEGVPLTTDVFGGGSPAAILTRRAESEPFDAIVVGSPHRGAVGRVLIGSVAKSLLNGAPCDVFVAPKGYGDERREPFRSLAVGYDGGPEAKAALKRAEAIARGSGAAIEILTAVPPPAVVAVPGGAAYAPPSPPRPDRVIDEAVGAVDRSLAVEGRRLDGPAADEIVAACAADEIDLLVVGSRGYGPVTRVLLGSVSDKVITDAPCPVLVVRRP